MRVKLVLLPELGQRTIYRLKKLPTIVGRGRDADLTIAHPLASRHHCELYEVDGTLCVRDLGSLNGTFVGGFRVTEAALESGDLLTIGGGKFEVIIEKDAPELSPPHGSSKPGNAGDSFDPEEVSQVEAVPELEPVEDSLSDIDFTDSEPPPGTRPFPTKSSPIKAGPPKPAPTIPVKSQPPAAKSPQPSRPVPAPAAKPNPKDAEDSKSGLDLGSMGEDEPGPMPGEDSGLNSFLRKL